MVQEYLLDTNVLIKAIRKPREYGEFFQLLITNGANFSINEITKLEFFRLTPTREELEQSNNLLAELNISILTPKFDLFPMATYLGRICARNKIDARQISVPDLLNGAFLFNYAGKIDILTSDLQDYPPLLFDCVKIYKIEIAGRLELVGQFKASAEKLRVQKNILEQT